MPAWYPTVAGRGPSHTDDERPKHATDDDATDDEFATFRKCIRTLRTYDKCTRHVLAGALILCTRNEFRWHDDRTMIAVYVVLSGKFIEDEETYRLPCASVVHDPSLDQERCECIVLEELDWNVWLHPDEVESVVCYF